MSDGPDSPEGVRAVTEGTVEDAAPASGEAGAPVVVLRERATPAPDRGRASTCMSGREATTGRSARSRSALNGEGPADHRGCGGRVDRPVVDLSRPRCVLCLDDMCPAVIGDVLVYRDNHHITATFAPALRRPG